MSKKTEERPALTKSIDISDFKNYYWLKSELIRFCHNYVLSTRGSKIELTKRIEIYFATKNKIKHSLKTTNDRDSKITITRNTLVVNYRNDVSTRSFFVKQIGLHFRFNAYLRQFSDKNNIVKNMTYGDLVNGWLLEESRKKEPCYKSTIQQQFEYNQFARDFFANEKGGTRADMINAWKVLKAARGANTYSYYKSMTKK